MGVLTKYVSMYELDNSNYLLINALSGAIDLIDVECKEKIKNMINDNKVNEDDIELFDSLKDRGYIFPSRAKEMEELERQRAFRKTIIEKSALMFVICPTTFCNLNCKYCFESQETRSNAKVMSDRQIKNIFSIIRNLRNNSDAKLNIVELFGGEPLLPMTMEVNKKIFQFVKEEKMLLNIITNGTHLLDYKDLMKEYKDQIMSMQITIDGTKAIHDKRRFKKDGTGTFDLICQGIDMLLEVGLPKVNIRVNIDNENIDYLEEFVAFIDEKRWREHENFHCDIAPVTDHTDQKPDEIMEESDIVRKIIEVYPQYDTENSFTQLAMFRILEHIAKVLGIIKSEGSFSKFTYCEANRMQFYVFEPSGKIYACPEAVGEERYAIGDFNEEIVFDEKLLNLWSGRSILTIPKCIDCNIAPFCGGGCAYAALGTNGDINDPVCNNAHEVISEYLKGLAPYILEKFG
ncbi:radical SAM protein [Anaerocolumna sp. AGMB13025]|uniref:radical SAM/SPASM domain-containing protein n=1 Tax=Anaerocolumna sp. AGMB13025 TaxID=3039116 RepID=UPI0024202E73|nr:radical SAM protein [Anaerocolumna sp. AGMB13025]WFR56123.1 radical SAM protein [Anaerocolumna sp. AGMB13025]